METLPTRREVISKIGHGLMASIMLETLNISSAFGQSFEPRERPWYSDPKNFWETVDPKRERILEIASEHYSPSDLEDLTIFTPFYLAGQIKFEVSWLLLWITHQEETTVSKDRNPDGKYFKGAMQRSFALWPDRDAEEAISDMSFLKELPQRYSTDAREILWAASFIRAHTNRIQAKYPKLTDEESMLESLYNYCAPSHALSRINKYNLRKTLFTDI